MSARLEYMADLTREISDNRNDAREILTYLCT